MLNCRKTGFLRNVLKGKMHILWTCHFMSLVRLQYLANCSKPVLNHCFLYLQPDGTELFSFVSGYPSWADYLTSMDKDATWGDHLMLYAAANCYDTSIRVINSVPDRRDITITSNNAHLTRNSASPLVLGHIQELHYVSLQPRKGTRSKDCR